MQEEYLPPTYFDSFLKLHIIRTVPIFHNPSLSSRSLANRRASAVVSNPHHPFNERSPSSPSPNQFIRILHFPIYETGLFGNLHELTERNNKRLENGNPSEQVQPSPTSPMSIPTHIMVFIGVSALKVLLKPS